jgi:hypothetical protein
MLRFNISYPYLIKFLYFMDIIETKVRRWKEAQRQGEDRVNLWVFLIPKASFTPYCGKHVCNLANNLKLISKP